MMAAGVEVGWGGGATPIGHWAGQGPAGRPGAAIPRKAFYLSREEIRRESKMRSTLIRRQIFV